MELSLARTGIEKKFFDLCNQVVEQLGLELYDLIYVPGVCELKVFIMNAQTKTAVIEDCVLVDHALTPFIDTLEWMPSKLTLEVSSPGLYRNLREAKHFESSVNEKILISLGQAIDAEAKAKMTLPKEWKSVKKIRAILKSFDESGLTVAPILDSKKEGKKNNKQNDNFQDFSLLIPFTNIKKVSLDPDYNDLLAKEVST